ncbi:MAG TPA: apolipoprotein N-acyltransferase [Phycisphaerales bacterium]|nr:apolipoprotein N-acyltransferase [Phycisphaerales bacterium]
MSIERRPLVMGLVLGGLSALMFALSFPGVSWWPLAFVAITPLVVLAMRTEKPARSALGVFVAWLPALGYLQQFAWTSSVAGFFPLVLYTALYPAAFVWIFGRLCGRFAKRPMVCAIVIAPVLWTGLEVLRGEIVWHGYPWYLAGQPTVAWDCYSGTASVIGMYGVGWMTLVASSGLAVGLGSARSARRASRLAASSIALAAILGGCAIGSCATMSEAKSLIRRINTGPLVRIAVVQTNVPQSIKNEWTFEKAADDFARFLKLSQEVAQQQPKPDLIIWPETMFPGMALNAEAIEAQRKSGLGFRGSGQPLTVFYDALLEFQQSLGVPMLVGSEAIEGLKFITNEDGSVKIETSARYNSAFLIRGGVVAERYDKMHLTPFGEEMPYISAWPWLEKKLMAIGAEGMSFELRRGTSPTVFEVPIARHGRGTEERSAARFVAPICFETTLTGLCRALVFGGASPHDRRAELMVNITNDGWFYTWRGGRECHMQFARWRCIELGTPMVRAANTGVSCVIDSVGYVMDRRPQQWFKNADTPIEGVLTVDVPLGMGGPTAYVRWGWVFPWVCLGAGAILTMLAFVPRRGGSKSYATAGAGTNGAKSS